ncbi:MAG: DUF459 domain-containing protein [Alphaproteobacteria bacterium]|nr:DUF459 domain-containing protein [Alphaproteobacteria bacterium]
MMNFRPALCVALGLALAMPASLRAQDQGPAIGSEATAAQGDGTAPDQQAADAVRRVLIVGDQLAGGMGAGLTRMSDGDDTIEVVNRFNESSGLTRPEIYDWAAAIPKMAENKNFAAAFVLVGLNDRRDMRSGDKVLAFNSPEWQALYKQRVDGVLDALAQQKIKVFWLGEPPMGDAALDADMQALTALEKERVTAKGGTFIELRTPFLGPDGKYADRGPDDTGTDRRLRESDGVTFFKQGNNRLGQIALSALKGVSAPAATPDATPADAQASAAPLPAPAPVDQSPLFAQEGVDGGAVAQGSGELVAAVAADAEKVEATKASSIGIAAAKGSNAESLLTTGLSAAAPAGRFDDFSAAAPAQ